MSKPTTAEIRERHERTEKVSTKSKWGVPCQAASHNDRGILLDRFEAAEATIQQVRECQRYIAVRNIIDGEIVVDMAQSQRSIGGYYLASDVEAILDEK